MQRVLEYKYIETLKSFLFEAKARVDDPTSGCTGLIVSLQQMVKELQSRVTALEALQSRVTVLEARLKREYSSANPSLYFSPPESSSRFLSSAENITPNIISTTVNLSQPGVFLIDEDLMGYPPSGGLLRLLIERNDTYYPKIKVDSIILEERKQKVKSNFH
ncbi:hypothetical protein LguiA_014181 [Lonicera macranthoides]